MANFYSAIVLTGGGTGALDKLNGSILNNKDGAIVITESSIYVYHLDAASGAAENSPLVISPDSNADNKRWILKDGIFAGSEIVGDMFFTGANSGLPFGEISVVGNAVETAIASQNTYVQITIFDTNGESNNVTPDHTNNHNTIIKAGRYSISCSITLNSIGGAGSTAEIEVKKNNGASRVGSLHVDRTLAGGGAESGAITLTGFANLAVDDTIEVWLKNETNTQNYVVEDITLSLMQVGG